MDVKLFQKDVNEAVPEPSERRNAARRALAMAVVGLAWLTAFIR